MPIAHVALGGNTGPVADNLDRAVERLADEATLLARSRSYRTQAVGAQAGADFLNGAVALETDLAPLSLLALLQAIETRLDRVREIHWGPRTVDLDLILYGDQIVDTPRLTVPHPACWYRRFVLDPLSEIAADVWHPERGLSIGTLRSRLLERPFRLALAGGSAEIRKSVSETVSMRHPIVQLVPSTDENVPIAVWLGPGDGVSFDDLPPAARLDASAFAEEAPQWVCDVLDAALGEPVSV